MFLSYEPFEETWSVIDRKARDNMYGLPWMEKENFYRQKNLAVAISTCRIYLNNGKAEGLSRISCCRDLNR